MADKDMNGMVCCQCGKRAAKKIRWFTNSTKNYSCLALCREHGYLKGKIRVYKTKEGKTFAVKIVKLISEENAALLMERYQQRKEKKRGKRNNSSKNQKN